MIILQTKGLRRSNNFKFYHDKIRVKELLPVLAAWVYWGIILTAPAGPGCQWLGPAASLACSGTPVTRTWPMATRAVAQSQPASHGRRHWHITVTRRDGPSLVCQSRCRASPPWLGRPRTRTATRTLGPCVTGGPGRVPPWRPDGHRVTQSL